MRVNPQARNHSKDWLIRANPNWGRLMERRTFLQTGLALGAAGIGGAGGIAVLPELVRAFPSRASGVLELDHNENPLGIAPSARRAIIDGMADANRYPGGPRRELVKALAAKHGVKPENIVLGAGSTEVLQMAVQAVAAPDAVLVLADPTFEDVPGYARPYGLRLEKVPLDARYAHDVQRMHDRAKTASGPVLVYICNPNNPTATLTPSAEVDGWIESAPDNIHFIVDEAYYDYVDDPSYWSSAKKHTSRPNVLTVRTFSKIYAMAGMRLGYGIAQEETAERLRKFMARNNANHLALVAAMASLDDDQFIRRSLETNDQARQIVHRSLNDLGLEYLPSHTNFVMHRINGDLERYIERMKEQSILVGRPFPPMLSYNRLSLALPEEMERFAEVLPAFRERGWV